MIRDRSGDHSGRFTLPDGREAYGTLSLAADHPPQASLYLDMATPIGPEGRGFPHRTNPDRLVGRLSSNEDAILGDVHLSEWFADRFHAAARWALVGLSISHAPDERWTALRVRITGLETLLGNAISATSWPQSADTDPPRFSADLNTDADFVSTAEGVTVEADYETRSSPGAYAFSLSNFATVTLTADSPLTVDEWLEGWVDPLGDLVTLATGEREEINTVHVNAPDPRRNRERSAVEATISGQLFGPGIHQREQAAERRTRRDGSPLVPLFTLAEAPPLATLLRTWQADLAGEAATSLYRLAMDPTLPAHVRFLLCAQACEALDVSARTTEEIREDEEHDRHRAAARAALEEVDAAHLDEGTRRFIRKNLARRPLRSFAARLKRLVRAIPDHETRAAEWTRATEQLATELDVLNRRAHPLHERLASARNALSHGTTIPVAALEPATRILEDIVRGQLLIRLGFDEPRLRTAYERMARDR